MPFFSRIGLGGICLRVCSACSTAPNFSTLGPILSKSASKSSSEVGDFCHGDRVSARACVLQRKTERPVQFEITPPAREAAEA